jgi:transposase
MARKCDWTWESILKYIKENNITSLKELKENRISIYHWVYRNKKRNDLPFENMPPMRLSRSGVKMVCEYTQNQPKKYTQNQLKGRLRDHYDINIGLPYLREWAEQEGVSLKKMCYRMGYAPEWDEWMEFISENLEQMGLWEMNEVSD